MTNLELFAKAIRISSGESVNLIAELRNRVIAENLDSEPRDTFLDLIERIEKRMQLNVAVINVLIEKMND